MSAGVAVRPLATRRREALACLALTRRRAATQAISLQHAARTVDGKGTRGPGGLFNLEVVDFSGSRVPTHNGAGIRFARRQAWVRESRFVDNGIGILISSFPHLNVDVLHAELDHMGHGDGRHSSALQAERD